jgi:ribose transport system ATP-binding protein
VRAVATSNSAPDEDDDATTLAIDAQGVEKVYGATVALAGASLVTHPGEIHGLLGENGAGKSTLVRILAGIERADAGRIHLFGESVATARVGASPGAHAFIHQNLGLFPTMSVAANIALTRGFRTRGGLINDAADVRESRELLDRLGAHINPRMLVGELPLADQTAVAIARALSTGVRLIVLDEPTAYLEARQVRNVLSLLGRLRSQGVACLLITHRAGDVLSACDSLTVLRDGRTVAQRPSAGLSEPALVELISGHSAVIAEPATVPSSGEVVLELRSAATLGFGPLSAKVSSGEVVAFCGLADAGAAEVGRAVFGLSKLTEGTIALPDGGQQPKSPGEAVRRGVAFVPPDRRNSGIAETLSVRENIFMKPSEPWYRPIRAVKEARRTTALMESAGIYPTLPNQTLSAFSGGNQQKAILARALREAPKLLVLNEPTAGVDLAGKAEIHNLVRKRAQESRIGVLLISSDFSEVAELADRIYVMHRKQVVAEVSRATASANHLVALAYGGISE